MTTGKVYDLKVGYSCNNSCFHCVVKPDVKKLIDSGQKIDVPYSQLIDLMKSKEFIDADTIVITGGEATLRKEFMRILLFIRDNYPKKQISLQTNGRQLKKYINEIYNNNINISYTVALHGEEDIHNKICGIKDGNAFKETMESIDEIERYYGDFNKVGRIEIVLSRYNLNNIPEFIESLYDKGINRIGISYPHLDGYSGENNKVKEIGFSYLELKKIIPQIYNLCIKYEDLLLMFEEVPRCMWRDTNGNLFKLPKNIADFSHNMNEEVIVKFPGRELNTNFVQTIKSLHKQSNLCGQCVFCCNCLGAWYEAIDSFNDEGFIPITKEELGEI